MTHHLRQCRDAAAQQALADRINARYTDSAGAAGEGGEGGRTGEGLVNHTTSESYERISSTRDFLVWF